jgi:hypothetical protein
VGGEAPLSVSPRGIRQRARGLTRHREESCRRGSRGSASDPSRRRLRPRWALGAVLFVRLRGSGSAENLQTERAARKIRPGGSPTARILPDAGLLVVWRQGQRGCFGEARAHRQRTEPTSCRPATEGTPAPRSRREREESPVDAADRPRPESDCQTGQALSTYPRPSTALSTIPLDSESATARWVNTSGK